MPLSASDLLHVMEPGPVFLLTRGWWEQCDHIAVAVSLDAAKDLAERHRAEHGAACEGMGADAADQRPLGWRQDGPRDAWTGTPGGDEDWGGYFYRVEATPLVGIPTPSPQNRSEPR